MTNATKAQETRPCVCDLCGAAATWASGGGAWGRNAVCDLHRAICDAEPWNEGTEWDAVSQACAACERPAVYIDWIGEREVALCEVHNGGDVR